jgi:hypothetical protein
MLRQDHGQGQKGHGEQTDKQSQITQQRCPVTNVCSQWEKY